MPSRPAKGLSLTEKVISIVGAEIFTNSIGSTAAGEHIVSPIVTSPMPLMATMLPAEASWTLTRCRPSNW